MKLISAPRLGWEPEPAGLPGWFIAENDGCSASVDTNKPQPWLFVFMSEAPDADMAGASALMG